MQVLEEALAHEGAAAQDEDWLFGGRCHWRVNYNYNGLKGVGKGY